MEVEQGEAVFLCGASGAGKTTLLYTLAGLERPESGTVEFEGRGFTQAAPRPRREMRNRKMGFVFQGYFLLPELTALENVMLPGMISGRAEARPAEASLRDVGLADRMHHLPAELSGGEQQRVAIARALTNNPDIIFADEPTGNLDSKTGDAIIDLLLELARSRKKTLLVVTHDSRLAERGDRQSANCGWRAGVVRLLYLGDECKTADPMVVVAVDFAGGRTAWAAQESGDAPTALVRRRKRRRLRRLPQHDGRAATARARHRRSADPAGDGESPAREICPERASRPRL